MADQFPGVQASSGTPALIGVNTKALASTKQNEIGEFPGVLLRAFLGGKAQTASGKTGPTPDACADKGKEKKGEADQSDPSVVAIASSVAISLPLLVASSESAEANSSQVSPLASQCDGSPLISSQATPGGAAGLESVLSLMEPVEPEDVDLNPVPAEQQSGKGKLLASDPQQGSQGEVQDARPVYRLLRDLALGMFSTGSTGSAAEHPVENMVTFQNAKQASDIAQSILSSTEKITSGGLLHAESPVREVMRESAPEKTGVQVSGSQSTPNTSGNERIHPPVEPSRIPGQVQVLTGQKELTAQQSSVEEVKAPGPASSAPILMADPPRKSGESAQESIADAKTIGIDRGAKQSDSTSLPQGVGVNASASEHELNDALTGRSFANVLHQQGIEPRQDAALFKDAVAVPHNPASPLTPELSHSVLEQVVKGLAFQVQGNISEMRLMLKPESLGDMALKVRVEDGKLQAQIDVSQPAIKAIVETNLSQLRQELTNSGIDVQRIDVFAAAQDLARESAGNRGDKPKHRGNRRPEAVVEATEPNKAVKMMGYNTMEVII